MPFNLGIGEVLVVLVIALLVFGKRLPEVGRSLGRGIVEFKEGLKGAAASLSDRADAASESTAAQVPEPEGPTEKKEPESTAALIPPPESPAEEEEPGGVESTQDESGPAAR